MTRPIRLVGECNQCGLCCFIGELRCINLIVTGEVGQLMATKCAVHGMRYPGMPIIMVDPQGRIGMETICGKDDADEAFVIIQRGIGKGCSLDLVVEEKL